MFSIAPIFLRKLIRNEGNIERVIKGGKEMNFTEILSDVRLKERALILTGLVFMLLFLILAVASIFDPTQILGVNRWIKPMKFAVSIGIFLTTLAFYLNSARGFEKSKFVIRWGAIGTMIIEIVLIVMQAARGTTSHFNVANAFDASVFSAMGIAISLNTLLIFYLLRLLFRAEIDLPRAVVWGMRFGVILFLLASVEGGYMAGHLSHTVGAADGGEGLPIVNWSNEAGDLRVAHFIGLHAVQIVPLASLFFVRLKKQFSVVRPTLLTAAFSAVYLAAFSLVFIQALRGEPVFGTSNVVNKTRSAQTAAR